MTLPGWSSPSESGDGAGDATARFTDLVQRAESAIPLDELLLTIAAHDHPVDDARALGRLDELASVIQADGECDADALASHLFVTEGFRGNTTDYGDPDNSYLDVALERRVGIPITLSVLMIEVGRRCGVALSAIGMPGHFLVGAEGEVFYDPFDGGARLSVDDAREIFTRLRGDVPFCVEYLAPVGARSIAARVLANLLHAFVDRDPPAAVWAARLRLRVPGLGPAERRETAALLGSLGRFEEAASELDAIASLVDADGAEQLARDAAALRARAN
jgi:regulator of sirC expression with transglutaminase-like and TPR domain